MVDGQIQIIEMEQLAEKYGNNKWSCCREEGKQEKEFCELVNVEIGFRLLAEQST